MADELIDILDEKGNLTNKQATKSEVHAKGLWHRSAHIWIYNSKNEVLVQQRAYEDKFWPGQWDVSAAGHVSAGETPEVSALRELGEELGINIEQDQLVKLGIWKVVQIGPEYSLNNYEFTHAFLVRYDGDLSALKLQKEEVKEVRFVPIDRFKQEFLDQKNFVDHGNYDTEVVQAIKRAIKD
jgi:isopentenyldiphosphate isomerase